MSSHHPINDLDDDMPFAEAARKMIWTRFETMWRYREATIAGDVDALHDMRVGSRRLRAALDMAEPAFSGKDYKTFGRLTKRLTEQLGAVRDGDVLVETLRALGAETGPDGQAASATMERLVSSSRDADRERLIAFFDKLDTAGYARLAERLWNTH